ncbi:MAG TPA: DUF4921 family protein, partial [bacterium]|nr:DUF4921 family protein [bacterium]
YESIENLMPDKLNHTTPLFRRIPNLFEIVTMEYWKKNFGYTMPEHIQEKKVLYLKDKKGYEHVMAVINMRLKLLGLDPDTVSEKEKIDSADAFFAGGHELIVAHRHYIDGAEYDSQLKSSGEMTPDEHFLYLKFTLKGMLSIYDNNPYVRYISVFQNWLRPAGASFDHLHKQLVAIDEWGVSIERELALLRKNPNIYNEMGANLAIYFNLLIAENDSAIAFSDIGHRFPTICIFSKSNTIYPYDLSDKELKDFSDLVHATHASLTSQTAANEEWYYTPKDSIDIMPMHILIKLRTNTPAGFEGGTKIYINPMSPYELKEKIVTRMQELKKERKIANIKIGEECSLNPNPLKYYLK